MKIKGVFLRGGIYYFRQQIGHKRVSVSLGTGDLGEAVKLAIEKKSQIVETHSTHMFSRAVDDFLRHCEKGTQIRRKTFVNYAWCLKHAKKFFSASALEAVNEKACQAFLKALENARYSNATIQIMFQVLHLFFNWCAEPSRKLIKTIPTTYIKLPKLGSKINRSPFCTNEQRMQLLTNCGTDPDLKFVLLCGFCAGLRKLEICEARRDWFNLEEGYLHVKKAEGTRLRKGEKPYRIKDSDERTVPLVPYFKNFLSTYLDGKEVLDFALHPEVKHGKSDYRWDFQRPFERYIKEQGMEWITPHTMRRTFASLLVQAGVSITKVSKWLGDDVAVTDKHYAFLAQDDSEINKGF